jgi:hypothetical protein
MAKISVRHGVARAYGFLFGRLFQVLGLSWLPAVFYAVAATYLIQRVSGAMQSAVPADAGLLGEYPFFYFLALIAVTAFLGAVIAVPLTRDALGLRDEPVAVHFVVGPREARMFFALLRFYAVEVVVLLVLAVAAGIGVSSAVRYADTQHLHLGWAGISLQGWLDIGAAVVAAAVFLMVASRLGFLLSPMAAAEKHVKLVRAGQLSRGNFWRIAFTYLIVGLPATLLLATCETTIGGLQMGKTLPSGMQAFYTVETGHIAIFAAILAGGLVALQALFAGASAAAYDELAEAAAYEAAPVEVETPAYREPVMAFADARPRDFGDARPGDTSSGVPVATISPPPSPPSGPRSMIQSAVLMTSRLCSITTHRVAVVDQLVQHFEQLRHVVEMQAGGRLVEDIERAAGGAARQFLGQLHALRLAARQRRRLLADAWI